MSELSPMLTPAKVCEVFDIAASTLDEWTRRREIKSFVLGRVRRYEPAAVLDLIVRKSTRSRTTGIPVNWQPDAVFWERINRLIEATVAKGEAQRAKGQEQAATREEAAA